MYPNLKECARCVEKSGIALKTSSNPQVPLHTHKWFEFVYIIKGKAEYRTDSHCFIIQEGNYYIIDYDMPHEYHRINNEPFQMVNIMFSPNFIDQSFVGYTHFDDILKHYPIRSRGNEMVLSRAHTIFNDTDGMIKSYVDQMQTEYSSQKIGYREVIRGILSLIIIQIIRNISVSGTARTTDNRSYIITDYIRMHFHEKIKIEDAFPDCHYSLPYMSKKFKDDMGMTFTEYIKKVRIEESCRLLINSDKTILEIAEAVGYPDTTFYHKSFRSIMKVSPNEYRKQHQKTVSAPVDEMVREKISKE